MKLFEVGSMLVVNKDPCNISTDTKDYVVRKVPIVDTNVPTAHDFAKKLS